MTHVRVRVSPAGRRDAIYGPALGDPASRPQYCTPARDGVRGELGALGAPFSMAAAVDSANKMSSAAMPRGVKAAIDASPLSSSQKRQLKSRPLDIFLVMAQFSEDQTVAIIKRIIQLAPRSKVRYATLGGKKTPIVTKGGRRVSLSPRKGNAPLLAAQFLAAANEWPMEAARATGELALKLGVQAPLQMVNAAVVAEVTGAVTAAQKAADQARRAAEQAAQQAGETANQVVQAGQRAANDVMKSVSSWFGLGGAVTGGTAAAATGGTAAGGVTLGEVAALLGAAVALAEIIVPPLTDMAKSAMPKPPTKQQVMAAAQDVSMGLKAQASLPPKVQTDIVQQAEKEDRILGLPPVAFYGLAGFGALGSLALLLRRK